MSVPLALWLLSFIFLINTFQLAWTTDRVEEESSDKVILWLIANFVISGFLLILSIGIHIGKSL